MCAACVSAHGFGVTKPRFPGIPAFADGSEAVAHVETGFISTQEIVDKISEVRRVDTIYTKDFSELTGTKAVIVTA